MSTAQARIDGCEVLVSDLETILDATKRMGLEIPTLCHVPGLRPEGGCRLCLVEVEGEPRPLAACHSPIADGMEIRTTSPRLEELRRELLDLHLSERGPDVFVPSEQGSGFEALLARYDLPESSWRTAERETHVDRSHPYLRFDAARCIHCRRCLHGCEETQGQFVFGVEGRGHEVRLVFGPDETFAHSDCVACGVCVDLCPTGALTDRDRETANIAWRRTRSTCGYCGVGCQVEIESAGDQVLRIGGAADALVNRGHLCAKGRYAHGYRSSPERLHRPLLRRGRELFQVSWDEALDWLARHLGEIRDRHGPDALGAFTSSRSTNEAAYLLQKLFRTAIGTNNIDCCARVCHSSTSLALRTVTGAGAASASYADIERARCIVVAGANATEAHPVLGARIKQAALRGVPLIVIDPRRIELAGYAAHHLQLHPGSNVALFNGLAKLLIEEGWIDHEYLAERTDGLESLAKLTRDISLPEVAQVCGVSPEALRRVAAALGHAGPTLFVHGLGLSEQIQGTASVMTLCNLGMLTGSIGRAGAGMLPLRGQNNVQGNADMGAMPNLLTGYQALDAPEVQAHAKRLWGVAPPELPGKTLPEMLDCARAGELRALWIQGEDVAQSDPDQTRVIEALERLDLLIVQELFPTETTRYAHLVLPAAGALEQDGTFTNGERRIQRVHAAVDPPHNARPDWQVIRDLGCRMGLAWDYPDPGRVMAEIAEFAPVQFGGVSYERLEGDGLQWPCPHPEHPGTASLHATGFVRGRGQLVSIDYSPGPEHAVQGYPYTLVTGRVLQHYNVGTMTRRTPSAELVDADLLEIHPDDALREGIAEGDEVALESRWGRAETKASLSRRVAPGELFLSFHFPKTHTNRLTGPDTDPDSHCPGYKVTAVRLSQARDATEENGR